MLLTIEKLVYGGDGLARGPEKAIFVPFVLEGEQVEAEIIEERPGFARAELREIIAPSRNRLAHTCPYFARCGGCHYQHTGYEHQLEIKAAILRETLRRTGKLDWTGELTLHPSPPWNYRNRTRMRIMHEPTFSLAYFRFGSHQPLAVAECPISSPLINRAIAALNTLCETPEHAAEMEFFAGADDRQLMIELYCTEPPARDAVERWHTKLRQALPEVASVAAFAAPAAHKACAQPLPRKLIAHSGEPALACNAAGHEYRVSAGSFFQTNRHMTGELIRLATADRAGSAALDLYAGVGLFTLPLAQTFERVLAVESSPFSAADLRRNVPANVRAIEQPVERFLAAPQAKKLRADFVIVDPPRAGLGERTALQLAALNPPHITYVSCDPATLARDLRVLLAAGYSAQQVHLVDLFPQTFHLETVVHLARTA
ncbi:MAG TPA: 23S rRNA (uracil(1939)-C(5))-methyltransferase RlmD [Terriglobales bacterium]|nr:23S rRNA (uracil(1939)-C(5))-methyltransferase RlmD [Terriglobales bacterium]